jgi:hypothetical protein
MILSPIARPSTPPPTSRTVPRRGTHDVRALGWGHGGMCEEIASLDADRLDAHQNAVVRAWHLVFKTSRAQRIGYDCLMVWDGFDYRSVGFWKVKVVQKATELRALLLLLRGEVAFLDDLDHLIERTPPAPLACSPRPEGCTASAGLPRPRHLIFHRSPVQAWTCRSR